MPKILRWIRDNNQVWTCLCISAWRQLFPCGLAQQWQSDSQQIAGLWKQNSSPAHSLRCGISHTPKHCVCGCDGIAKHLWMCLNVYVGLGVEHRRALQHNSYTHHQRNRWRWPIPTIPAVHSPLSQSQQPRMRQSCVHCQHHRERTGKPGNMSN